MNRHSLVSVIIIFLNEKNFLQEAIDSVFDQTYENWELLLVDDGSTDGSTEIALRYAKENPGSVHYFEHGNHQNLGMSFSRNLGLRNARGKYIAYLDGDDVWLPHKLEQQVAIMECQPEAAMVYGPLTMWYSWTGKPEDLNRDHLYGLQANGVRLRSDILLQPPRLLALFLRYEQFIPTGILVKREALLKIGGAEEIFRGDYEDAAVLVKLCLSSAVFVSSQSWFKYRQHPNSHSKMIVRSGKYNSSRLFFLNWVENYLSAQEIQSPEVWQALQKVRYQVLWNIRHPKTYCLLENCGSLIKEAEKFAVYFGHRILPDSVRNWLNFLRHKIAIRKITYR